MLEGFMSEFHFLRPWVLIFLVIPFLFYFFIFKNNNNLSSWEKVCDKQLLNYLLIKGQGSKRKIGIFMMYLGLISAIVAAAGPTWKKKEVNALSNKGAVMVLLNLSSEMLVTDVKPDRLSRAKIEISQLLTQLKSCDSGLIVYTDEPFLISPLSTDYNLVVNLLDAINLDIMPVNGDRLDRAIGLAVEKMKSAGNESGDLVIFTADAGMSFNLAIEESRKAAQLGYNVNIVNMSMEQNRKLEQISEEGNGEYIRVGQSLDQLISKIKNKKENLRQDRNKTADWLDFGWYISIVTALCCLSFFRKGILVIVFSFICSTANAGFMFSDNYIAKKSFDDKNYEKAAEIFKDEKWKGASFYKAGDYDNAIKMFEGKNDIESMYNYGNSLAKSGKIEEAIKAYESVLQKDIEHADAKFNLEYLKKQQQQNDSKNQQKNNEQKNQQNKNQNSDNQNENREDNKQKESAEQDKNNDENNDDNQKVEMQNAMADAQADQEQENNNSNDNSKENQENKTDMKMRQDTQEQQIPKAQAKQDQSNEKYDEEVQAKVQKFREIPEDKGGLLRMFIQQEYLKGRYGE